MTELCRNEMKQTGQRSHFSASDDYNIPPLSIRKIPSISLKKEYSNSIIQLLTLHKSLNGKRFSNKHNFSALVRALTEPITSEYYVSETSTP